MGVLLGGIWHWLVAGLAVVGVGAVLLGWTNGALDRNGDARRRTGGRGRRTGGRR